MPRRVVQTHCLAAEERFGPSPELWTPAVSSQAFVQPLCLFSLSSARVCLPCACRTIPKSAVQQNFTQPVLAKERVWKLPQIQADGQEEHTLGGRVIWKERTLNIKEARSALALTTCSKISGVLSLASGQRPILFHPRRRRQSYLENQIISTHFSKFHVQHFLKINRHRRIQHDPKSKK